MKTRTQNHKHTQTTVFLFIYLFIFLRLVPNLEPKRCFNHDWICNGKKKCIGSYSYFIFKFLELILLIHALTDFFISEKELSLCLGLICFYICLKKIEAKLIVWLLGGPSLVQITNSSLHFFIIILTHKLHTLSFTSVY